MLSCSDVDTELREASSFLSPSSMLLAVSLLTVELLERLR